MTREYAFSDAECIKYLAQLDRLGIIELRPLNRYRLKVAKGFRWLPHGPVMTLLPRARRRRLLERRIRRRGRAPHARARRDHAEPRGVVRRAAAARRPGLRAGAPRRAALAGRAAHAVHAAGRHAHLAVRCVPRPEARCRRQRRRRHDGHRSSASGKAEERGAWWAAGTRARLGRRDARRAGDGRNAAERAIDKEVVVAAPIEAVWQAWTTRAGIRRSSPPTPRSMRASAARSTSTSTRSPSPA